MEDRSRLIFVHTHRIALLRWLDWDKELITLNCDLSIHPLINSVSMTLGKSDLPKVISTVKYKPKIHEQKCPCAPP